MSTTTVEMMKDLAVNPTAITGLGFDKLNTTPVDVHKASYASPTSRYVRGMQRRKEREKKAP